MRPFSLLKPAVYKERLTEDLKIAMKARDEVRLRTIRTLRAALMEREIAERQGGVGTLTEEQELAVLQKQAKQRQESMDLYASSGRDDLAAREREELAVIEAYLPQQASDEELAHVLSEIITQKGASSAADLGKVMGEAMKQLRGKADGKRIQQLAQRLLSGAA